MDLNGVEFLLLLIWPCLVFGDFGADPRSELRDIANELRNLNDSISKKKVNSLWMSQQLKD